MAFRSLALDLGRRLALTRLAAAEDLGRKVGCKNMRLLVQISLDALPRLTSRPKPLQVCTSSFVRSADVAREPSEAGWGQTKVADVIKDKVRPWCQPAGARGTRVWPASKPADDARPSIALPVLPSSLHGCASGQLLWDRRHARDVRGLGVSPGMRPPRHTRSQGTDNGAWLWCSSDDLVIDAVRKVGIRM